MNILTTYTNMLTSSIDETGIYPMPAIAIEKTGESNLMSFITSPEEMLKEILNRSHELAEYIVGIDSYTEDGQGTTLDSAVIICHIRRDAPPRIGGFEYSYNDGSPITKPVNWENEFWNAAYASLVKTMDEAIKSLVRKVYVSVKSI